MGMWTILTGLAAVLASTPAALAGKGRDGGDPTRMRERLISDYIVSSLRSDALSYLNRLNLAAIEDTATSAMIAEMLERGLKSDIESSAPYELQSECRDKYGNSVAATALNNDYRGPICFSAKRLAEMSVGKAEIIGLALHEYAHHFGFEDMDSAIYLAVFKTVQIPNTSWGTTETVKETLKAAPALPAAFTLLGEGFYRQANKPERGEDGIRACDLTIVKDRSTNTVRATQDDSHCTGDLYVLSCNDQECSGPQQDRPEAPIRLIPVTASSFVYGSTLVFHKMGNLPRDRHKK